MCSIWGFARLPTFRDDQRSRALLISRTKKLAVASSARGTDATGIAWLRPGNTLRVWKGPVTPAQFAGQGALWQELESDLPTFAIGHGRQATHGAPAQNVNNHPVFSLRAGIALVHNGVISNHEQIIRDCGGKRDGQVDTEALLRSVMHQLGTGKGGYPSAIRETVNSCYGSQAVALLTQEHPDRLYLWRAGNPLALGYDRELGVVWFGSLGTYVHNAADVSRRVLGFFNISEGRVVTQEPPDRTLLTITPGHEQAIREDHIPYRKYAGSATNDYSRAEAGSYLPAHYQGGE